MERPIHELTKARAKAQAERVEKTIEEIAKRVLAVDTLEEQGRDSLDFYDLKVTTLRAALLEAYEAGRASRG